MAALFRIDQVTPGEGILDRSRSDLVPGEIISLSVPSPVVGATYTWEIVSKIGSTAALGTPSGSSTAIGPPEDIGYFCGFLVKCTETINGASTSSKRVACVRSEVMGLRPILFGEASNALATLADRRLDEATYNEVVTNLDGVTGDSSQSWTGYAQAMNELTLLTEQLGALVVGGGLGGLAIAATAFSETETGTRSTASFAVLLTQDIEVAEDGDSLLIDAVANYDISSAAVASFRVAVDGVVLRTGADTTTLAGTLVFSEKYTVPSAGTVTVTLEWQSDNGGGEGATDINYATLRSLAIAAG